MTAAQSVAMHDILDLPNILYAAALLTPYGAKQLPVSFGLRVRMGSAAPGASVATRLLDLEGKFAAYGLPVIAR